MGKRPQSNEDMELQALKSEMQLMNKRMEEVMNILTGNTVYGIVGIKKDVHDLKSDVQNIKVDIEGMKREEIERQKKAGFFSIKLDTIPQKIAAIVTFLVLLLTAIHTIKQIFITPLPQ
jgi:hypothetical protein